jgi:small subunit ribosomal protein S1
MVLDVDPVKRRISLGLKQVQENPWVAYAEAHPVGTEVEGAVRNITEFGLFVGLDEDLDGMVHLSDLDWNRPGDQALAEYNKGDMVRAVVLDIDVDKERIGLGIKQLGDDPFASVAGHKRGDTVTCTVVAVEENGLQVTFGDTDYPGYIRRGDLARDRDDQRPQRFAAGDKVDAMITNVDRSSRRINLSIRALEIEEEKQAVEQYGSTDSGASLGDILGAAMNEARSDDD